MDEKILVDKDMCRSAVTVMAIQHRILRGFMRQHDRYIRASTRNDDEVCHCSACHGARGMFNAMGNDDSIYVLAKRYFGIKHPRDQSERKEKV